jgi:hypothetical protein
MEVLANEADVPPGRIQDYWAVATDLITLVTDIEELQTTHPGATSDDPALLALRRRLRDVASRLAELMLE